MSGTRDAKWSWLVGQGARASSPRIRGIAWCEAACRRGTFHLNWSLLCPVERRIGRGCLGWFGCGILILRWTGFVGKKLKRCCMRKCLRVRRLGTFR